MNANGSDKKNLTDGVTTYGSDPAYSPDGARIVFGDYRNLSAMGADGSNARRLTDGGGCDPIQAGGTCRY